MVPEKIVTGNWGRNAVKPVIPANTGSSTNLKSSPQESNPQFKAGTNMAGTSVKLADGTDYVMKGASSGAAAPATSTTPTPVAPVAPTTPETPVSTSTATTPTTGGQDTAAMGLDEAKLLASGISQEQIDKMKLILSPALATQDKLMQNAEDEKSQITSALDEEQQMVEAAYGQIKEQRETITQAQQDIINDSADVQKSVLEQGRQKELFENAQAQSKYKLDQARNERETLKAQRDLEQKLARSLSSSMGVAFSFSGMMQAAELQQSGIDMISDLQSSTAYGAAEFSFKAQDIERNYSNAINGVEVDRRDQNIILLKTLNDDLAAIDEKVLLSAQEKKKLARETISSYFDSKNEIDTKAGELISTANSALFDEKKALEQEARESQTADLEMSAKYGYFVNKYGEAVNKNSNGTPKTFVGDYDMDLSAMRGFLVDSAGRPILDERGNKINYTDPAMAAFERALANYSSGEYSEGDASVLNGKVGTNNFIANTLENGKRYKSAKYGNLQCGEYINDNFLQSRLLGSDFANADQLIAEYGGKKETYQPSVGDVVFMNTGDPNIPHKAIVEGIDEEGNLMLTDANYVGAGVVRHGWKIKKGDDHWRRIYGFATLPLRDGVAAQQPLLTSNVNGTDGGGKTTNKVAQAALAAAMSGLNVSADIQKSILGISDEETEDVVSNDYGASTAESDLDVAKNMEKAGIINAKTGKAQIPSDATAAERTAGAAASKLYESSRVLEAYAASGKVDMTAINDIMGAVAMQPSEDLATMTFNKLVGEYDRDPATKAILKAMQRFTEAKLRRESGAAIAGSEYLSTSQMFFPDPGDSPENIAVLKSARKNILDTAVSESGRASPLYYAAVLSLPEVGISSTVSPKAEETKGFASEAAGWLSDTGNALMGEAQNVGTKVADTAKEYYGYADTEAKETIDYLRSTMDEAKFQEIVNNPEELKQLLGY